MIPPAMTALAHVACWAAIAGAAALLGLQLAGDHVGRWVTPAQALTMWLVPIAGVAAILALLIGRHPAAISGAAVTVVFLGLTAPLAFPAALPPAAGGPALRVVHANLLFSNPAIDDAVAALADLDADVLALSELTPELASAIAASPIGDRYPYTVLRPGDAAIGLGIWSRVPLEPGEPIPGSTMTLTADIDWAGEPLHLVLAHPLPPLFQADHWRHEMAAMAALDPALRERTLLVADLNVSYFHPPFRRFLDATGWTDVHQALGHGFSVSWPTDEIVPPFVRLDHALVGSRLTATGIDDHAVPGGDHRAFAVSVTWAAVR